MSKLEIDDTGVGSYFIANYPPFSFWRAGELSAVDEALDRESPGVPLGLYIHIPFCRKRCKFCYFRVYTDKNSRDIEAYLRAVTTEVELLGRRKALERPLRFAYFGGGTPSFLSAAQIESLVEGLTKSISWSSAEEVTFECEPGTLSRAKVKALAGIGVTRLSLGIENFDDDLLQENGRAHLSAEIFRAWEWIDEAGFPAVNVDLIAGMVGETDENWDLCIEKTLSLSPDSVTIYQMELPFNTVYSREMLDGEGKSRVATWSQKREWVRRAFSRLKDAGYHVSSGYTLVRDPERCKFVYRDALWRGADMVGVGVASFSHVSSVHYQNLDRFEDYVETLAQGRLPLSRALRVSDRERLIRELVLQMKLGRLDASYFREKFGASILEEFAAPFAALRDEGYLDWKKDRIELTSEGLLRVDSLLPGFFLPQHRNARYT
ncbi:MAG TPA: coproporphyrinogen-III oxidase family protein [Vicinamibacteria bacterium]